MDGCGWTATPSPPEACQRHRLMTAWAEHANQVASSLAGCLHVMQVPVEVVYLDRSGAVATEGASSSAGVDVDTYKFVPEACSPGTQPRVSLLYR